MLLFDGDCGICTASADFLVRRVRSAADVRPYQWADVDAYGLTEADCAAAVQWVGEDAQVKSGSRAVMAALRAGRQPWPVIGRLGDLPGIAWLADRVYRWVAENRERLPGSTPACAVGVPRAEG